MTNTLFRLLVLICEAALYGPPYGVLNYLIRSPMPLEPEACWRQITAEPHPVPLWISDHYPPQFLRRFLLALKRHQDHVLGISKHYDVSNEFYELFLDRRYMFYSCADFRTGHETIEEAQQNKADFILHLLDHKPGERILELGCGWGAMLKRIYEATGDKEKPDGLDSLARTGGLQRASQRLSCRVQRFYHGRLSRAGVGQNLLDRRLGARPPARRRAAAGQAASRARSRRPAGAALSLPPARRSAGVISQLFFPGSIASPLRFHVRAHEAAGFRLKHLSVHDYRPTLRAWFENLVRNRQRAIELVGVRTYNRYLVFFAASWRYFDRMTGCVFRLLPEKPRCPRIGSDIQNR